MGRTPEDAQVFRGLIDAFVLHTIAKRENYAYGILKETEARLRIEPPILREKSLYPLLHRLQRRGFLTSHRQPGKRGTSRRYYRITRHGLAFLGARLDDWRRAARILSPLLSAK
jgi:PadR family transcriptional regulator PadR